MLNNLLNLPLFSLGILGIMFHNISVLIFKVFDMRVGEPARVHCKRIPKPTHSEQSDSNPYVCVLTHAIIGLLDELVHHPVAL